MKIVVAPRFDAGEEALAVMREVARVTVLDDGSEAVLREELRDADALLVGIEPRVTRRLIESAPLLRHIARQGVGVDIVDVAAATERGIIVTNVPDVTSDSVAEFAMTLLLAVAKNICLCNAAVKGGRWQDRVGLIRTNVELHGKTHGVIGLGRIGKEMAKRASGFNMKVLYHDSVRCPVDEEKRLGIQYVDKLPSLLSQSDFISIHVPLTPDTRHFLGEKEFALMKPTAVLVNTSRGPVIDQKALYQALKNHKIFGAGIDVTETEPIPADDPLLTLENIIIAPHIASASVPTRTKMAMIAAENLLAGLRGEMPPNCANPEALKK